MTGGVGSAHPPGTPDAPPWSSGPSYARRQPAHQPADLPPPGQAPLVGAGLAIGILLMGIQLWLLTIALELFLGGLGTQTWSLALISGLVFVGGLAMLWILQRRSRVGRSWSAAAGIAGEALARRPPGPAP